MSKGKGGGFGLIQEDERVPEVFVRGRATYSANLNPTNPIGSVQSIEHTLRNLDKLAAEQQNRVAGIEKELADYTSRRRTARSSTRVPTYAGWRDKSHQRPPISLQ